MKYLGVSEVGGEEFACAAANFSATSSEMLAVHIGSRAARNALLPCLGLMVYFMSYVGE